MQQKRHGLRNIGADIQGEDEKPLCRAQPKTGKLGGVCGQRNFPRDEISDVALEPRA